MSNKAVPNLPDWMQSEVSVEALAALLDLSAKRIQQLVGEGVMHKSGHGRYPVLANVNAYLAYLRARLPGPRAKAVVATDGEVLDPAAERTRLARSQRLMIDLRRAERARRLIPIDLAEREYGKVVSLVQAKMRALPALAAPLVAGQEPQEALVTLDRLVFEALHELAGTPNIESPMVDDDDVLVLDDGEIE